MSRINTNVSSIIAQRILSKQNNALTLSLERLSTGMKINKGKDDPAGLIASERMRAEMAALQAAQTNISRAVQVISVAESGLREISELMNDLESLIDLTANETAITDDEVRANQLEIDAILSSIDRIANSTELQGKKLLNGDLAYTTSNVNTANIANLQINSARIANGGNRSVTIDVVTSARFATIGYTGGAIVGTTRTIEVVGNDGTERFSFGSGTTLFDMRDAINAATNITGVSSYASAGVVYFTSTGYGSSEFVRVRELAAPFAMTATNDSGEDATVNINGQMATSTGLRVSLRSSALNLDITLSDAFGTQTAANTTFEITGGGAKFAITPDLNLNMMAPIGIDNAMSTSLGDSSIGHLYQLATGGDYSLFMQNFDTSQDIVRAAATQVAALRGRLGAFEKDTLDTTMNSLLIQYENVAAAESIIRDTDFAAETANMTRAQILVQAASMVLGNANQSPQNVLALLQ
jgi:flagellin